MGQKSDSCGEDGAVHFGVPLLPEDFFDLFPVHSWILSNDEMDRSGEELALDDGFHSDIPSFLFK